MEKNGNYLLDRRNRRSRNKSKKINTKIVSIIISAIIILILALIGTNVEILNKVSNLFGLDIEFSKEGSQENPENIDEQFTGTTNLEVYFIDVGQADSILILNDTQSMLIDAGNNEDGEKVVNFIKDKNIQTLNYVIRNSSS